MAERNYRYHARKGQGFGLVLPGTNINVLKTITVEQLEAIVEVLLLGDIDEIAPDELLMGRWAANDAGCLDDKESNTRLQAAAAMVYLSGHLAEDVPTLRLPEKKFE